MKKLILIISLLLMTTMIFAQTPLKMTSSTLLIAIGDEEETLTINPPIEIYLTDENLVIFASKTQNFTFVSEAIEGYAGDVNYMGCYAVDQNDKACYITLFTPESGEWLLNITFVDYELYYSIKIE